MKFLVVSVTFAHLFMTCVPAWSANYVLSPRYHEFGRGSFKLRKSGSTEQVALEIGDFVSLITLSGRVYGVVEEAFDWGLIISSGTGVPWDSIRVDQSVITEKRPQPKLLRDVRSQLEVAIQISQPSSFGSPSDYFHGVQRVLEISAAGIIVSDSDLLDMMRVLDLARRGVFSDKMLVHLQTHAIIERAGTHTPWESKFGILDARKIEEYRREFEAFHGDQSVDCEDQITRNQSGET